MSGKIRKKYDSWKKGLQGETARTAETRPKTSSDLEVEPVGVPAMSLTSREESLGLPGEYPFTRGIHPQMYRQRSWSMRQYAGFSSATETNQRFRYLLEQGVSGLSVAFDLPTQMGRDSDDPLASGEVGRTGVAIDSIEDMRTLFDEIDLGSVSTSMTINSTAAILLAMYLAVARERGVDWSKVRGTVQNDMLKEYIARGTYIYPVKHALRLVTDIFEFCSAKAPKWNTISVSGYHIREAGSDAAQELGYTMLNARTYLNCAVERGLQIEQIAPQISFFFNCHSNFLEEVAKFRAARRMWAKIISGEFSCDDARSQKLRFHTQTAGSTLIARQPQTNIVRTSLQALAAVFGGTQSLHTNGFDEALSLPSRASATLALRTQQIIAEESGVTEFVDPLAGSYVVEQMTDAIEEKANKLSREIEQDFGSMTSAISAGFPQEQIAKRAYEVQRSLESGQMRVVGVNYATEEIEHDAQQALHLDSLDSSAVESLQIERLQRFRNSRDAVTVETHTQKLREAAAGTENLVPIILDAVTAEVTLGEISEALREVFGEYSE